VVEEDIPKLRELYDKQGWKYEFPDFMDPQFVVRAIILDEDGEIVNAVFARKTVELYMLANHQWRTPKWRIEALRKMHEIVSQTLALQGFHDAHCWLPPEISSRFGRRLTRMFQWKKNLWACFSHETRH